MYCLGCHIWKLEKQKIKESMNLKSVDLRNEIFHIRIQIFITLLMVIESLLNYIITKIDIIIYVILRFIEDCLREQILYMNPYKI